LIKHKAIFLDRDGTIAKDVHYCSRPDDIELLPSVADGLKLLSKTEFKLIVITNQSGLARGFFTEQTLEKIHQKMKADIVALGGRIDGIYYCPHHPDDKCRCRKPEIGMIEKAVKDWDIDLNQSYFIGDKFLDIEAANKAGCKAVLVPQEAPEIHELCGNKGFGGRIDFICAKFITAAEWIYR
jgi:histidinol-phosphate phosphatase family protein